MGFVLVEALEFRRTGFMILYFLRHGLASDSNTWNGDDHERPLTNEGVIQIKASANTLKKIGVKVDAILSSPLKRAFQTAQITAKAMDLEVIKDERLAYGFGLESLSKIIAEHPQSAAIMLVGHEPDFSSIVSALTGGSEIIMKKGGLARVDLIESSPPKGELVWLLPPKLLAA
jgi:phosphohistidine phosphatase